MIKPAHIKVLYSIFGLVFILMLNACGGGGNDEIVGADLDGDGIINSLDSDPEDENIAGRILQSVTFGSSSALVEYIFDSNGNLTALIISSEDSGNSQSTIFSYNEVNQLIKEDSFNNTSLRSSISYSYDEKGNEILREFTDSQNITFRTATTYDEDGNEILKEFFDSNNRIARTITKTYENNNLVGEQEISGANVITTLFAYDDENNLLSEERSDNSLLFRNEMISYFYDSSSNLIKEEVTSNIINGIETISYFYDSKSNLIGTETDNTTDGIVDFIVKYEYDENNRLIVLDKISENNLNRENFEYQGTLPIFNDFKQNIFN